MRQLPELCVLLKNVKIGLVVVATIIGMVSLVSCGGSGEDNSPSAEELEERRKGFHCLDPWDGNHTGLESLIRDRLNDPGSMETIETRITPVDESGEHTVSLEFTAKNAFGGRVRHQAVGVVENETCAATLLGIE